MKNDTKYDTEEDLVVIVNRSDKIIGYKSRKDAHIENLLHRTTAILVFNNKGEMLLQKRSKDKDTYAGFYTVAAGGHVLKGQSFKKAAERELFEELRISGKLEYIGTFLVLDRTHGTVTAAFKITSEGPFSFNTYEIESVQFFNIEGIKKIEDNLTPQAKTIFKKTGIL